LFPAKGGYGVGAAQLVSLLLYADDLVLLSQDPAELASMLQIMDKIAADMGMCINASKTEIMSLNTAVASGNAGAATTSAVMSDASCVASPFEGGVQISGGVVKQVPKFVYLGGCLVQTGGIEEELRVRKGRSLARFGQFEKLWGVKNLSVKVKVGCYKAYVLPILLFGSESWALTQQQLQMLERVHTSCLRRILGVRVSDRHTNVHVRTACNTASLASTLMAQRLRWLGHVCRMEADRLPHIALFSSLYGIKKRAKRGKPRIRWEDCVSADLKALGFEGQEWEEVCQLRSVWRKKLWPLTHPGAAQEQSERVVRPGQGMHCFQHYADSQMLPFGVGELEQLDVRLPPPSTGRVLSVPVLAS
jgi:hypothetical protein